MCNSVYSSRSGTSASSTPSDRDSISLPSRPINWPGGPQRLCVVSLRIAVTSASATARLANVELRLCGHNRIRPLLHNVDKFVSNEPIALLVARSILPWREVDVAAVCEGARIQHLHRMLGFTARVDADTAQVRANDPLDPTPKRLRHCMASADARMTIDLANSAVV